MGEIEVVKLNHVALPITDRQKTLPFYRDVLGLEVVPSMVDNPAVIWTRAADGTMVHPIESPENAGRGGFHIAFQVADFDAAFARVEELGIEITNHGERHDGQRFLFIQDPDGNRIELTSGNDLKPHGRVTDEWGRTREAG